MKNTKSPIIKKPLRNPGQSLEEEITKSLDEELLMYVLYPTIFVLIAMMEWIHWYLESPPQPLLMSALALAAIIFSIYRIIKFRKKIKLLKQGRDGEKVVGQYLELFREQGMKVFHDIVGDNFNIDHLLVSKKGIYLIETKTYSKPQKGKTEIVFDGQSISINGKIYNDNIIIQVTAGASWLSDLIEELTAREFQVHPVVLFPGWYVKMTNRFKSKIWVLSPKSLNSFINHQPDTLSSEDVKLVSNHISRHIRSIEIK